MTDEQILKIASENLYCNMSVIEWSGRNEDILKFARAMYEKGRQDESDTWCVDGRMGGLY